MAVIRFSSFSGEAPRIAPHLLPKGFAQSAINVSLLRGLLEPLNSPSTVQDIGAAAQTLFLHSSSKWLAFTGQVEVVEGVVAGDASGRVFWTDGSYPKQSDTALMAIGGAYAVDPGSYYRLGLPAPTDAPVVTLADDVPDEFSVTRTYVYAWVHRATVGGMSNEIVATVGPDQAVLIKGMATDPPAVFPTGGAPANPKSFKKWLFEVDATTGQYIVVKKLAYDDPDFTDDGGGRGRRFKAGKFKPGKIAAPADAAWEAADGVSKQAHDRSYVYCWLYQEAGGAWKRTDASAAATVTGVAEGDGVVVSGMAADYATAFPAGAKSIRKMLFRTDGAGNYRLVAKFQRGATEFRDAKPTKRLGLKIGHWAVGLAGVPVTPTAAVTDSADTETVTHAYVQTWVSAWGEESAPGPVSNSIDLKPWQEAAVATATAAPSGYSNVTWKRLYRTDVNGNFRLASTIDLATGEWTDALDDDDLGDVLATTAWDAPPDGLRGLVGLPNGVLAGFAGNRVMFSEVDVPYAWPVAYRYTVAATIVALAVVDGGVLVLTNGRPYLCRGFDPATAAPELIRERAACVSARSVVDMGGWAMWASPDGLMSTRGGAPALETAGILTRAQWQALTPSSLVGGYWQGRYVGFHTDGATPAAFVFDIDGGYLTHAEVAGTAAFNDAGTDRLYVQVGDALSLWDGASPKTYVWRSGRALVDAALTPLCARVDAAAYPVALKLYSGGALRHAQTVADAKAFRLPGGYRGFDFEVEMVGTAQVRQVTVASTMEELAG